MNYRKPIVEIFSADVLSYIMGSNSSCVCNGYGSGCSCHTIGGHCNPAESRKNPST